MSVKPQQTPTDTPAFAPPDLETMRESAGMVLNRDGAPEAVPPAGDELDTLTAALRGHIALLAPEVDQAARLLPENNPTRASALACVGEAATSCAPLNSASPSWPAASCTPADSPAS